MVQYLKTRYPGIFQYAGPNGTAYGISYRSGGKKHREIIGPLLGEAQEKLAEKKAMVKKGPILSASEKRKITFEKLKEKYSELEKGERFFEVSKKHFVNAVSDFFMGKKLFQITPLDIGQFKKERKETPVRGGKIRSDVSVNRELEVLRHMLNKAVEWGMLDENPFTRFKEPIFFEERNDRVRFLEEDEIKRLLDLSLATLRISLKGLFSLD